MTVGDDGLVEESRLRAMGTELMRPPASILGQEGTGT